MTSDDAPDDLPIDGGGEVDPDRRRITLTESDDWWVAKDEATGVTTQGETADDALDNLQEAVALHNGEIGRPVTDDDLRELGIDPDDHPKDVEE